MYQLHGHVFGKGIFGRRKLVDSRGVLFESQAATTFSEAVLDAVRAGVRLQGIVGRLDLPGADLAGALITGDLQGSNLQRANLSDARLGNLANSKLMGARLDRATLGWAKGADFTGASLIGVNLSKRAQSATFAGADLSGAAFDVQDLRSADLSRARGLAGVVIQRNGYPVTMMSPPREASAESANWRAILVARGET